MKKQKIIIDTDCGMDDIIAILMLIKSNKFDILGITTVEGLTLPKIGKLNLKSIFEFINFKCNVIKGSSITKTNKVKPSFPKIDIRNSSKLAFLKDLIAFDENIEDKTKRDPEEFIIDYVNKYPKEIEIICLGPLTNIANTINIYQSAFTNKVKGLVIMGGVFNLKGNVKPNYYSEYNFYLDAPSADYVVSSNIPTIIIPLDACYSVPASDLFKEKVSKLQPKTSIGKIIQKIIIANKNDFLYFYDPLLSGVLINPKIVSKTKNKTRISVCIKGNTLGRTKFIDRSGETKVIMSILKNRFFKLIEKMIL